MITDAVHGPVLDPLRQVRNSANDVQRYAPTKKNRGHEEHSDSWEIETTFFPRAIQTSKFESGTTQSDPGLLGDVIIDG